MQYKIVISTILSQILCHTSQSIMLSFFSFGNLKILSILLIALTTLLFLSFPSYSSSIYIEDLPASDRQAGLININPSTDSNLFYWYFPSRTQTKTQASSSVAVSSSRSSTAATSEKEKVILWLQGGPGASGLEGNFFEMGPYRLEYQSDNDISLVARNVKDTWNENFHMLFLDQPVGTGYSYTNDTNAYPKDEEMVAHDIYQFLQIFFKEKHPELLDADFYVTGESYGGHYVPSIGQYIVESNKKLEQRSKRKREQIDSLDKTSSIEEDEPLMINLKGVAIGDGLVEPEVQELTKPLAAYSFGLINLEQFLEAQELAKKASTSAKNKEYVEAKQYRSAMEDIIGSTGINVYDVREWGNYPFGDILTAWANNITTKEALHLPKDIIYKTDEAVSLNLEGDVMKPQMHKVDYLLQNGKKVLIYEGQFDWKDGTIGNEAWIRKLKWNGIMDYLKEPRSVYKVPSSSEKETDSTTTEPAGFIQHFDLLTEVVVQGAGHLVPYNQPYHSHQLIHDWIYDSFSLNSQN